MYIEPWAQDLLGYAVGTQTYMSEDTEKTGDEKMKVLYSPLCSYLISFQSSQKLCSHCQKINPAFLKENKW